MAKTCLIWLYEVALPLDYSVKTLNCHWTEMSNIGL